MISTNLSTGLPALDRVLKGLMPGDNSSGRWTRSTTTGPFVEPFCRNAVAAGKRLVYFRFAKHAPLVPADCRAEVHELDPRGGLRAVHQRHPPGHRNRAGRGAHVFDCLSDLAVDWCSDRMLGNFFLLTCPYLYDVEALAYFAAAAELPLAARRRPPSPKPRSPAGRLPPSGQLYLHPIKVQQRHSPDHVHAARLGAGRASARSPTARPSPRS